MREMLWGGRWEGGSCLGTHVRKESSDSKYAYTRSKINKARDGLQKILSAKLMEFKFYPTCDKQSLSSRAGL